MVARKDPDESAFTEPKSAILKVVKPLVSIVIPTMYRPEALQTALNSAASQILQDYDIEIIVADNSTDASARTQVEAFKAQTSHLVKYVSEPNPGVANVRNAALASAKGEYIAFLDDDQEATADWLSKMLAQLKTDDTTAVFGHIKGRAATQIKNGPAKLAFFSRLHNGQPSGKTLKFYGCGASVVDLKKIAPELIQFDSKRNQTGGEDDAFFGAIQQAGGSFSWSKEAIVYEDVPESRLKKRYICLRSFAYGQGPSRLCLEKESFSPLGLVKWMTIGAMQMAVYFPLALLSLPFENAFHMKCLRKGCEGAGKFFWQSPFRPKLYGQAAVDNLKKELS